MILTKKKAIEISIELWTWLAETGSGDKFDWDGWKKYGDMSHNCPLCEYTLRQARIERFDGFHCERYCPLKPSEPFGCEEEVRRFAYGNWATAVNQGRKKFAKEFLEQLKTL